MKRNPKLSEYYVVVNGRQYPADDIVRNCIKVDGRLVTMVAGVEVFKR